MTNEKKKASVAEELEERFGEGLEGSERTEARSLIAALVADWKREAGSGADADTIHSEQRKDLERKVGSKTGKARLEVLRLEVMTRRVRRVSAQTYALGTSILDGKTEASDARSAGRKLLKEAEDVSEDLKSLPDSDEKRRLHRDLGDALMEALFAVEGKAMSQRLNRHAGEKAESPGGPPNVRPGR
jgi:hypothetical protein